LTIFVIYNACSGSIGFVFQTAAELSNRGDRRGLVVSLNGGEGGIRTSMPVGKSLVGERWYVL